MFTTDEWGNTVFHITTGKQGMKMFQEMGIKDTMTREEYKKHMDSYRRIQQERSDKLMKEIERFIKSL